MKIVIDRGDTGIVRSSPELTKAQKNAMWEEVVRIYARKHPEIFEQIQATEEDVED